MAIKSSGHGDQVSDPIDPTLPDLLRLVAKVSGSEQTYTDLPAKVLKYDAATQTVDAQPLVMVERNGALRTVGPLLQLQVRFPAGSTWSIVGDLVAGDFGWVRFAGADISAWKMQGTEGDPTALLRQGAKSDAYFEPGSQPISVPLAADAYKAGALVVKAASLLLGDSGATDFVALASLVKANDDAMQSWADGHSHGPGSFIAPAGGGAVTGQSTTPTLLLPAPGPDPAPTPGSVAAGKVKAI